MYNIPIKAVRIAGVTMLLLIALCWWLSLMAYAGRNNYEEYELGRAAERAHNPIIILFEQGAPFCYDGDIHSVKRAGKRLFRITQ